MNSDSPIFETGLLQVQCSCPASSAAQIAGALVERRLAACVQTLPRMSSVYRWEGAIEHSEECLLLIKTTAAAYPALEDALRELHPYELPEIIAVPITQGLSGYVSWIRQCVA